MTPSVGIRALSVAFPSVRRTNDFWRRRHPELVATAERATLARVWKEHERGPAATEAFDAEMAPYLRDPFRGTIHRRVLGPGESALGLEVRVAREALAIAELEPKDVECLLVTSFLPDQIGIGNATFLAKALELRGAAFNLETACTSAPAALQTATALVRSGEYERVMVVVSCTYSRVAQEDDTLGWFMGDGAAAFIVGREAEGRGVLATRIVNTAATCNTFYYDLFDDPAKGLKVRIQAHERTGRVLRDTSQPYLLECCQGAMGKAGVGLEDIAFFVFNTPTAWYGAFCARALGVSPARTLTTYPEYANIGPALLPVNLHRAARDGRIKPGDLVLAYSIGSASSAGAVVMRWGDVALGAAPREPEVID